MATSSVSVIFRGQQVVVTIRDGYLESVEDLQEWRVVFKEDDMSEFLYALELQLDIVVDGYAPRLFESPTPLEEKMKELETLGRQPYTASPYYIA